MSVLRIDTVRARLTAFYISVLAAALVIVGGLIYVLLARALYVRIDENLHALVQVTVTSLANDLAEGQDVADAARSTAAELSSRQQMLAIYDDTGRLLAEGGRDDDLTIALPALGNIPTDDAILETVVEERDEDDRHRLALRRVTILPHQATYIVVAGISLEPTDEELESLRVVLSVRRADRAAGCRHRGVVPGSTEPLPGCRHGRTCEKDERREPQRTPARRQPA